MPAVGRPYGTAPSTPDLNSTCTARLAGLNHSTVSPGLQPSGDPIRSRAPSAVRMRLLPEACGILISLIDPLAACRKTCTVPQAPAAWRYRPLGSRQASRSPKSGLWLPRAGVSALARAPLAGTSHSRGRPLAEAQLARMVPASHQRAGEQFVPEACS